MLHSSVLGVAILRQKSRVMGKTNDSSRRIQPQKCFDWTVMNSFCLTQVSNYSAFSTKHYLWPRRVTQGCFGPAGTRFRFIQSLLLSIRAIYLQLTQSTQPVSCKRFSELCGGFVVECRRQRFYFNTITFLSPGKTRHLLFFFFLFSHLWFEWIGLCQAWQGSDHYQRKI